MTKKEILNILTSKIEQSKTSFFRINNQDNKKTDDDKTGNSQFREIASICLKAQCYEEIELLVQYKEAKADKNTSWSKKNKNNISLAKLVIDCMKEIKEKSKTDDNDKDCLYNLSLFFGYLYWYARVWTAEAANN